MKGSPDKRSQEEESLVCVAPSESFLNGVRWQRRVRLGRSCHLVTHESECFHDQVKLSDSNSAVDLENRQHNEFFPSHSPRHLHWLRLSGKIKKKNLKSMRANPPWSVPWMHTYCQSGRGMFRHMGAIKNPANTCYNAVQLECSYQITTCQCTGIREDRPYLMNVSESAIKMYVSVIKQEDNHQEVIPSDSSWKILRSTRTNYESLYNY